MYFKPKEGKMGCRVFDDSFASSITEILRKEVTFKDLTAGNQSF